MPDIAAYKPLIAKTLAKCSGRGMTPEQVAAAICERISSFEEDMALMGGKALVIQGPTQEAGMLNDLQDGPYIKPRPVDITERIGSESNGAMIERFSKEQLLDFAKNEMPSTLMVKPPDYEQPFEIHKFIQSAPGDMPFVNVIYQPNGGQEIDGQKMGPTVRISSTDISLDGDELTESIKKQASALYTKTKRVLTPKMPAVNGNPGDLRGALSAEAPGTGEEGYKMPMDGTMSQQFKQQSRG